jgi:hypothetical protein
MRYKPESLFIIPFMKKNLLLGVALGIAACNTPEQTVDLAVKIPGLSLEDRFSYLSISNKDVQIGGDSCTVFGQIVAQDDPSADFALLIAPVGFYQEDVATQIVTQPGTRVSGVKPGNLIGYEFMFNGAKASLRKLSFTQEEPLRFMILPSDIIGRLRADKYVSLHIDISLVRAPETRFRKIPE